jgi:hypothetical protein
LSKNRASLYAAQPTGEVRVFNNASTRDGSVTPDRTITPMVATPITSTFGVAVDTANNILYLGVAPSSIMVFANADTANGSLPPARTLTFSQGIGSFYLDSDRDILYVARSDGKIVVFDQAHMLAAGTSPNRTMTLSSGQLFVFVDVPVNRLYAVNGTTGFIISGANVAADPMLSATPISVSPPSPSSTPPLLSAVAAAAPRP